MWILQSRHFAYHGWNVLAIDLPGQGRSKGAPPASVEEAAQTVLALLDAVARLQPGVLHDEDSHQLDSFNPALDGLLDCPHYTRPEQWQGLGVPAPLLSGHHAQIERWRRDQRLLVTARHRPDLLEAARARGQITRADEELLARSQGLL